MTIWRGRHNCRRIAKQYGNGQPPHQPSAFSWLRPTFSSYAMQYFVAMRRQFCPPRQIAIVDDMNSCLAHDFCIVVLIPQSNIEEKTINNQTRKTAFCCCLTKQQVFCLDCFVYIGYTITCLVTKSLIDYH